MNTGYVYKWTHTPSLKWYVGYHDGSNPDYVCSSAIVKELIGKNPEEWQRTIVDTGEAKDMYDLETEILQTMDARRDPRSYNQHNNEGKGFSNLGIPHTDATKKKIGLSNSGPKPERCGIKNPKNSAHLKGRARPKEVIDQIVATRYANGGYTPSQKTKDKIAKSLEGAKRTAESIAKGTATKKLRGTGGHSQETKDQIARANSGPRSAEYMAKHNATRLANKLKKEMK
jgi:hypothetical protein